MGIIDSNKFSVECPSCAQQESAAVHQKGSAYGSSGWQSGSDLKCFEVQWTHDQASGPIIISATCKTCGIAAEVTQL